MIDLSVEDVALLETAEIDAWESLFAAAPSPLARELGLQTARFGPALATLAAGIDVGQFNRVQGIGLPGDEDGRSIDEAVAWFRSKRLRNFLVQIPPGPNARALAERVKGKGLGLAPFRRSWTKFRRPPLPAHEAATRASRGADRKPEPRRSRDRAASTPVHALEMPISGLATAESA